VRNGTADQANHQKKVK